MSSPPLASPYVGLRPFREADYPFFFGRERDIRIILSNLRAQTLTVLYGASGVGKSSVLQAGVVSELKKVHDAAVVYFNGWQSSSFAADLTAQCRTALGDGGSGDRLDEVLSAAPRRMFLLLDQFEEFLLYHGAGRGAEAFENAVARIVNDEDNPTRVLIGIREDALSKFDQRFSIRIANLLGNTLPLVHLRLEDARIAVERPIERLNAQHGAVFGIEPGLTDEILQQVQARRVSIAESGGVGTVAADDAQAGIETAFLQLVLKRLWDEEIRQGSTTLRHSTLKEIGGASRIVQVHVNDVMASLKSDAHRAIAGRLFRYLVTPSRSKIAQHTNDLIAFGEGDEGDVRDVLRALTDHPDARILRRLGSPERYEIFHDVLAQPVLEWRRRFFEIQERAEQERAQEAERQRQRRELDQARRLAETERLRAQEQERAAGRFRAMAIGLLGLFALVAGLASYAWTQREHALDALAAADVAKHEADLQRQSAELAKTEALSARADAVANLRKAEEATAREQGKTIEADELARVAAASRTEQTKLEADVKKQRLDLERAQNELTGANEGRDRRYREAVDQIAQLKKDRDQALAENAKLKAAPNAGALAGPISPPSTPDDSSASRSATPVVESLFVHQRSLIVLSDPPFSTEAALLVDEVDRNGANMMIVPAAFKPLPAGIQKVASAASRDRADAVPVTLSYFDGVNDSGRTSAGAAPFVLLRWSEDARIYYLSIDKPATNLFRGVTFDYRSMIAELRRQAGGKLSGSLDIEKHFSFATVTPNSSLPFTHKGLSYELRLLRHDSVGNQYVVVEIDRVK